MIGKQTFKNFACLEKARRTIYVLFRKRQTEGWPRGQVEPSWAPSSVNVILLVARHSIGKLKAITLPPFQFSISIYLGVFGEKNVYVSTEVP